MVDAPRATVLIPSHEHGELLVLAGTTALNQTVEEIEVFVVLDGPDAETGDAAERLAAADPRVRLFRFDKGERHGEAHRHAALEEARGRIVCYLSDDDLWAPDHVESMDTLLGEADFANSLGIIAQPSGDPYVRYVGDLADPWFRQRLRSGLNFFPLSTAAHTLEAYRRLPVGWSPAPTTLPTDIHMWQKFLAVEGLRFVSGGHPTVLHVPSSKRTSVSRADRFAELQSWSDRLDDQGWDELRRRVWRDLPARAAAALKEGVEESAGAPGSLSALAAAEERAVRAEAALGEMTRRYEEDIEAERSRAASLEDEVRAVRGSVSYRAARRLARMPVIGPIGRWVGVVLARRGGR